MPICTALGIDPIHFGVLMTCNLAIGFVTPPVGVNLFVASSMTGIPVLKIARELRTVYCLVLRGAHDDYIRTPD